MDIDIAPADQAPAARRNRSLELIVAMIVATLVAPVAAPASVLFVFGLVTGGIEVSLLALPLAPFMLLTMPGMVGYAMGFVAVALLGTGLTALTLRIPRLRPVWIWTATGALSGTLIAAAFAPTEPLMLLCGTAAGGSCALLYRLIVARPLAACLTGEGALDCPEPRADLD